MKITTRLRSANFALRALVAAHSWRDDATLVRGDLAAGRAAFPAALTVALAPTVQCRGSPLGNNDSKLRAGIEMLNVARCYHCA